MVKVVDIDKDNGILLEDLELSERAKNALRRFLRVKTFGDLLKIDYEVLENTRSLGKITLEEIKSFVRSKGYFLFNETVFWKEKRDSLKNAGYKLLEDEGLGNDESRFFYINNFFTLDDIFYYGKEIFRLKGFGGVKQKEFDFFLNKVCVTLEFEETTELLKQYKESKKRNESFNTELLDVILIKEIGNLYLGTRKALIDCGIKTLKCLISIDYNELKDRLCDISDIELLELIDFLHCYGFFIKGYDQTSYNIRPLKKEEDLKREYIDINKIEQENLEIVNRIEEKQDLIAQYNDLMIKRQVLLDEEHKLDLKIMSILKKMEKVSNYGKVKVK